MAVELTQEHLDAGLVTTDLAAATHFYGTVLGLPLAGEMHIPGLGLIRRYAVGASTLRVFLPDALPARQGSREGFASQTGIRYLTLHVRNIETVVASAAAAGCRVPVAVRTLRPGVRVAQIEDADGNTIELMQQQE